MKKLLPFSKWYVNLLAAVPAFLLGAYFDLTPYRLDPARARAGSRLFLLGARVLGGLLLAGIVLALLRAGRDMRGLGRVGWRQMLILFLALNAVTALYVATSRTVYVWDNAGYWSVARTLSQQWLGRSQLWTVLESTVSMDYNYLLAWPVSLVMRLFGGSRAVFLFTISNLYTLPGLWGLCALSKDKKWGGLLLAGLFPSLIYTSLVGYVDVAACALAIWAFVVYTSDRPAVSRGVLTGALLVGTFLLRRYFFFFAASFGVAALAVKILFDRKKWADFLALFGSCALCAVYLTPNFLLEKVFGTNYGDLYAAYDLGLVSDAKLFCRYFGLALLLFLLVCSLVRAARGRGRRETVFALVQLFVCFGAFVSVQSHGQQHLLLYLPGLAWLLGVQLFPLPARRRRWGFLAAAIVFGWCLVPKEQPSNIDAIQGLDPLPSFVFYGPTRDDIDQLTALCDYVDALSAQEQKSAVVLASSFVLNSETLSSLRPSLNLPQPARQTTLRYQGTVDKRDPFNWNTLTADYLIIGDPVQTHLGEENQQVIALLAHDVLDGVGPGTAYQALPETFELDGGVTVRIYQRTRDLTGEEYRLISHRLTALYPDYAQQYAVPEWVG
jgi:hypothetical protein